MTIEEFEWDEGNREKNWIKHRVTVKECEEAFVNTPVIIYHDVKHSEREVRFIFLGKSKNGRLLHIVFTRRLASVRVISARDQNKRERSIYEDKKTNKKTS